jgi:hypothetical protein
MAEERRVQRYQKLDPKLVIWIEKEVFALKTMGLPFEKIQDVVPRAASREIPSRVPLPDAEIPLGFSLSLEEVHEAFKRGIAREPKLTNEEWVAVDNRRSEDSILSLQVGIRDGDPEAIDAATRVREHSARINGLIVPPSLRLRAELTLKQTEDEQEEERKTQIFDSMTIVEMCIFDEIVARARKRAAATYPELWASSTDANGTLVDNSTNESAEIVARYRIRGQTILKTLLRELEDDGRIESHIVRQYFTNHYGHRYTAEQIAATLEFSLERIVLALKNLNRTGDIRDLGMGQWTSNRRNVPPT